MIQSEPRELLLSCLHRDPGRLDADALPDAGSHVWDELLDLAATQRVRPLLYRGLKRRGLEQCLPPRITGALKLASRETAMRNLRFLAELGQIARALGAQGAPVMALKGAHLTGEVYRDAGLREMSDLDILVRPEHLPRAVDAVHARGYRPDQPFTIDEDMAASHHLTRFAKGGVAPIEVHWNITPPLDPHAIDPEELWHRATPWSSGGVSALGLCLEDLLLHLCFHTSFQHQFRFVGLRPFCDMAMILDQRGPSVDWSLLLRRARAWNWTRGVYLSLQLARDLLGAEVPASALHALQPASLDTGVLEAASDEIFASSLLPGGVARLVAKEPVLARLRRVGRRVLDQTPAPRARPLGWLRLVGPRLVGGGDLLRRHGPSLVRLLLKGDPALVAIAERTNRIRSWLEVD
jgi:hypothetical protein